MRRTHYIFIAAALLTVAFVVWFAPRSSLLTGLIEHQYPGIIPASSYARNLDSSDPDTVMTAFYYLTKRANPIAVPRAIELLKSPEDYIWLNAAIYLGACNHSEAVPYLIKAFRHTAWRSGSERAQYLHRITGEDFGTDFSRWQQWWIAGHPDSTIDWNSHLGPIPRLANTK